MYKKFKLLLLIYFYIKEKYKQIIMAITKDKIKHLTNQALTEGAKGLISVLDIDGNLYEVHDNCISFVVEEVDKIEERVTTVESTVGTHNSKIEDLESNVATAEEKIKNLEEKVGEVDVTELETKVNGFLGDSESTLEDIETRIGTIEENIGEVNVTDLKDTVEGIESKVDGFLGDSTTTLEEIDSKLEELEEKQVDVTDAAVEGKYVTHITKDTQGVISSEKADLTATIVKATKGETPTTVQTWLAEIQALLDTDGGIVAKVQQIVKELEDATGDTSWNTIVDKLRGIPTDKTVKEYVDETVAAAKTELVGGTDDTKDSDTIKGAKKYAEDKVAGVKSELETSISVVDSKVDDFLNGSDTKLTDIDTKLEELEGAVKSVNDQTPDEDGNVTVTAADINITYTKAGEEETASLEDFLDEREEVLAAALNDLDSRIKSGLTADDFEEKEVNTTKFEYSAGTLKITTAATKVVVKKADA